MDKILKEAKGKRFAIEHFTVTEDDVQHVKFRDRMHGTEEYKDFHTGTYVRLVDKTISWNHGVVMSNTPMELETNREFIDKAHGDVLIGGLGLGMVLLAIQDKPEVTSITVVEKYQEVVDLVKPQLPLNSKVKVIVKDVFKFETKDKFDTIYFDIWNNICGDNLPEMKNLHKKFRKNMRKGGWMNSWRMEDCRTNSFI